MTGGLPRSLRARLLVSLAAAVGFSAVLVAALQLLAENGRGALAHVSRLLIGDEWPEPWQDLAVLLPSSVLVLLLAWAVSLWSLRPLLRASQEASLVGPARPEARIAPDRLPTELLPLVDAVNGALDRLAHAWENERRFTADAAHELRTPIAALRLRLQHGRIEGNVDFDALDRDCAALNRLASQLLDLARKDRATATPAEVACVNMARVAREAASVVLPLMEEASRPFIVDLPDAIGVIGNAADLRDMLRNLLENALAHGAGTVTLAARADGGRCVVTVRDEGAGVAPALREAAFERFRKAGGSDAGCGLGLAIARAVASGHGGTIRFVDGPACVVVVDLPATERSATGM